MAESVTQNELERMVIAATLGQPFQPSSPYAREVWERIKRDVAEIQARGTIVDIPPDFP